MMDKNRMMKHIKEHVNYPTSKAALMDACNRMTDIPDSDKKWFADNLPDREYKTPEDVMQALGM